MKVEGGNDNATMDADMVVIDGKLYVAFACTNLDCIFMNLNKTVFSE